MAQQDFTAGRVWEEIEGQRVCMFVDHDGQTPRARPMAPLARRDENRIWFLTDRASGKVADLRDESPVCLTFQDKADNWFVSLVGAASVVDDPAKVAELWAAPMKEYFAGPEDPAIVLIAFEPLEADVWTGPGRMLAGLKMLVTAATGARTGMGEHGKVEM